MTFYIGITGQKGTGKTTLSTMIKEALPDAEIIALADALKRRVHDMLFEDNVVDIEDGEIESLKSDCLGPMYQGYGELIRRKARPDFWIRALDAASHCQSVVIVPDVRHVNEAEWIKAQGGLLVAIVGPSRWESDQRDPAHPSEANVPACQQMADITVPNYFSLTSLRSRAREIADMAADRTAVTA